jgi:hypothetical protein
MAPAPVTPSPEAVSSLAQIVDWARDWGMPLFGGGFLVWVMRAASWKRGVEETQKQHSDRIGALETANDARLASHNKLEVAVAALPRRDEVREMINELREDWRTAAHMAGGRG